MYNTDLPTRADLPTSGRLWRSTIIAAVSAVAILVTVVLPSEYGIDPTGSGRMLGLTEMGEIKMQLAREAEADRQVQVQAAAQTPIQSKTSPPQAASAELDSRLSSIERRLDTIATLISAGTAQPAAPLQVQQETQQQTETALVTPAPRSEPEEQAPAAPEWRDEISYILQPGEGIEYKLVMQEGAEAEFEWTANGSKLNYDTHGDGSGNSISYEKGRSVPEQTGIIRAAFTGNHGWFWRNRTDEPVTLILRTRGDYSELKRTV